MARTDPSLVMGKKTGSHGIPTMAALFTGVVCTPIHSVLFPEWRDKARGRWRGRCLSIVQTRPAKWSAASRKSCRWFAWPTNKLAGRNIRISQNCGQFSGQGETRAKSIRLRPGRRKGIDLAKSLDLAPGSFRQNLSATAPDVSTGLQVDLRTPCGRESVVAVPYGELTGVPSISAWQYRHWIKCRKSTMTVCLT